MSIKQIIIDDVSDEIKAAESVVCSCGFKYWDSVIEIKKVSKNISDTGFVYIEVRKLICKKCFMSFDTSKFIGQNKI